VLERQRLGRLQADREEQAAAERQAARRPRLGWAVPVVLGVGLGLLAALPLPSARHICAVASQGGVGCALDKVWLPVLQKVALAPIALILVTHLLLRLPGLWRRWRAGKLEVRKKLVLAETDDPILRAASWGLVMREAGGADRPRSEASGTQGAKVRQTGAKAFITAAEATGAGSRPRSAGPGSAGPGSAGPGSAGPESAGPESAGPGSAG
jgi:hypothetical protein